MSRHCEDVIGLVVAPGAVVLVIPEWPGFELQMLEDLSDGSWTMICSLLQCRSRVVGKEWELRRVEEAQGESTIGEWSLSSEGVKMEGAMELAHVRGHCTELAGT